MATGGSWGCGLALLSPGQLEVVRLECFGRQYDPLASHPQGETLDILEFLARVLCLQKNAPPSEKDGHSSSGGPIKPTL